MLQAKCWPGAFGAAAAVAAGIGLGLSAGLAAERRGKLAGTDFVAVPAEKSGLTHQLDLHTKDKPTGIKWPWLSPPVSHRHSSSTWRPALYPLARWKS